MTGASANPKKLTLEKDLNYIIDCVKLQPNLFVFNLATIKACFALFGPFRAIFGVGVKFKNFFKTFLCKQSILVLEAQPYRLVLFGHIWGLFCTFWGLSGLLLALWGRGQVQKDFWYLPI